MTRIPALVVTFLCVGLWAGTALAGEPGAAPAVAKKAAAPAPVAPVAATPADQARADIKAMFGFVPAFLNSVPDSALPGAWEEMKGLQMNPNTALPAKIKELIGLAVAAQIPCQYCVYAHTEFAKLDQATKQEVGEAVIVAALARHWSTVFQGQQTDLPAFKATIAAWLAHGKKMMAGQAPAPQPVQVIDAATAKQDMQQSLGSVPDFANRFPAEALPGAWKELRDVEMSPTTALSGKYKSLIGLAVASQIPCRFCIAADTEFAKSEGATDREINEAIAMAAITRHWSTYLNGTQADEAAFKRDVDRLIKGVKQQMKAKQPVAAAPATDKHASPVAVATPQAGH